MNQILHPDSSSDVPWPTSDDQVPVPDTSMLPGSEKATLAAAGLLKNEVQSAHDTTDRLADGVTPAVQQLGASVSTAEDALRAKTDPLSHMRSEWAESLRTKVRSNPLVSVAAAVTLGALIARYARITR